MTNENELLVFMIDDDIIFSKALEMYILKEIPTVKIVVFPNGEACLHELHRNPDVILLDYILNSEFTYAWDGIQVLKKIKNADPGISVIMLSSSESVETAMECINSGALDYVVKNQKALMKIKEHILSIKDELITDEEVESEIKIRQNIPGIIGIIIILAFIIILLLKL